jgi:hypothetical protein
MPALCRAGISRVRRRASDKIDKVAHTIAGAGGSAEAIVTDTTSEDAVARLFERAMAPRDSLKPVDLVAYNAGNNQRIDFREVTPKQFEDFWRVGCFGGFLVGREAARRLVPLGRGTVLFTGASASLRGKPGYAQFAAAKAGLRMIAGSEVVEQRAKARQQPLAGRGRRHAARRPVEEAHAKPALELPNGLAQSRARDAQLDSGLGKAPPLRNGNERVHLRQVRPAHWSSIRNSPYG